MGQQAQQLRNHMTNIFFQNWDAIGRIIIVGVCLYAFLVFFLRISGKRTLGQMNAFDFLVTVALGSTLSSTIVSKDIMLAEGVTAIILLILLQYLITFLSVRFPRFDKLVKSSPSEVAIDGSFNREVMKNERITEDEIRAAMRAGHWDRLSDVKSVVLEPNGKLHAVYQQK